MRAILSMQMQQETVKAYSGMTSQEVISAISAKGISSSQYADVYDNYVASSASGSTYNNNLKKLGYVDKDSPSAINIYASSFENKDQISACIDDYNADAAENDQISYTDYVGLLMSSITTIINAISYILIAFVAVSLVVSSIMIGIITYISVLERKKEIGILRSIWCEQGRYQPRIQRRNHHRRFRGRRYRHRAYGSGMHSRERYCVLVI